MTSAPPQPRIDPPLVSLRPLPELWRRLTRHGPALYRRVDIASAFGTDRFFAHYKANKRSWIERGFELDRDDGGWGVQQWLTVDRQLTQVTLDRLAELADAPTQGELGLRPQELVLDPLPAELEAKLFGYQVEPARQIFRALTRGEAEWGYPGAVDFSEVGTGKSFMTLAAALATGRRVAVLCPPAGHAGWVDVFRHFGAEPYFLESYEAVRGNWRPDIVRQRPDRWFEWQNPKEFVLILDECQAVRHDDSLTARCCGSAIWQKVPIIAASATAAINPIELRVVGRIVGLHQGGQSWERFLRRHGCYQRGRSWKWGGNLSTLSAIHSQLFPRRGCRVRRQDLGDLCPETIIEVLPFDCSEALDLQAQWEEAQKVFSQLQASGLSWARAKSEERAVYQRVWMRSELALVPHVVAHARQQIDEDRSVAIFSSFTETRLQLGKALGTGLGFFGGQSKKARKWILEQFQADKIHVLVSNIRSGGASVSLHDIGGKRPRTSYIFASDHVINVEQATGRVDRVGSQSVSRQFIPTVRGTILEQMVRRTRRKMLGIATLNDGKGSSKI